jgi:hypothetical protein
VPTATINREEFVVVGWTDPEGSQSHIGALLLGYHADDGRLHYAGRPWANRAAPDGWMLEPVHASDHKAICRQPEA